MARRLQLIDESIERYLGQIVSADRVESSVADKKTVRLNDKISKLKQEMGRLKALEFEMMEAPDEQVSLTDPDALSMAARDR